MKNFTLQLHAMPTYTSRWQTQIDDLTNKILNRDKFDYNFNADPLYQMYREQAVGLGKRASEDTMAQASALSGGFGNSYATTAASKAYQDRLMQLDDIIPTLRQSKLSEYNQEGDDMLNRLNVLKQAEKDDYNKYENELNAYLAAQKASSSSGSGSGKVSITGLDKHVKFAAALLRASGNGREDYALDYLNMRVKDGTMTEAQKNAVLQEAINNKRIKPDDTSLSAEAKKYIAGYMI